VFDYIERFCNLKRRHSAIGYLSPMEVRAAGGISLSGVIQTGCRPAPAALGTGGEGLLVCLEGQDNEADRSDRPCRRLCATPPGDGLIK
jgi:hypothetical protein